MARAGASSCRFAPADAVYVTEPKRESRTWLLFARGDVPQHAHRANRKQAGWSVTLAAWRPGVSPGEYRELDRGRHAIAEPLEIWDRICKLYSWPQTFTVAGR